MKPLADLQIPLIPSVTGLPPEVSCFPRFRYMGTKFRLLPWIHDTLSEIDFTSATDAFSGSGVVSYLLKSMGKQVRANDTLAFPSTLTTIFFHRSQIRSHSCFMRLPKKCNLSVI